MDLNRNKTEKQENKIKLADYVEIAIYLFGAIVVPALIIIAASILAGKGGPWYVPYFFYGFAVLYFILQIRRVIRSYHAAKKEAEDNTL